MAAFDYRQTRHTFADGAWAAAHTLDIPAGRLKFEDLHPMSSYVRQQDIARMQYARALDRGMAGAMVALARHAAPGLTPAKGPAGLADVRVELQRRLVEAFTARLRDQPLEEAERDEKLRSVRNRTVDLLDSWQRVVDDYREVGTDVKYQRYERPGGKPLLREMLDTEFESEHHRKFRANRSLRDVEPEVHLYVQDPAGGGER